MTSCEGRCPYFWLIDLARSASFDISLDGIRHTFPVNNFLDASAQGVGGHGGTN
jgi:hypothetical protein